jgi:CheY-like chemotaxis protein
MPSPLPPEPNLPPGFLMPTQANSSNLLLQGVTVLVVEDSRYACEALRLMCQRAGARLRRADTLQAARGHLRVYRPDVVIIDLGLPDGRGEALIRDLVLGQRRPMVILGTSGNPAGRGLALAAGADGFLDKPLESFASFCRTLRQHLPGMDEAPISEAAIMPDPLALQDDLSHAATALAGQPDAAERRYVTGFLLGLAQHAHDAALASAAHDAGAASSSIGLDHLRRMVNLRLTQPPLTVFGGIKAG